jgi:alkylhydroperoxidase family enzyme
MTAPQRISYVPFEDMTPDMRAEMERCAREGTPRPESSAIRAHVPAAFWFFANAWNDLFRGGIVDHSIKELCRVYVSRSVKCEYCGNQRSERGRSEGLVEGKYDELMNFESSKTFTDREKAALAYAEAIAWTGEADDALWERLYAHFDEAELVELGCFIGLTLGQQSWLRLLGIEHHQVMPGTSASMAPGFETADALAESKSSEGYWAATTRA